MTIHYHNEDSHASFASLILPISSAFPVPSCNGITIWFDHRIETANGFLLAAKFDQAGESPEMACTALTAGTKIRADDLHARLGHANNDYMRLTAKDMGIEVTGKIHNCESCAIGKAKQRSVPKIDDRTYTRPGELRYMDISGIRKPSKGGKRFWIL